MFQLARLPASFIARRWRSPEHAGTVITASLTRFERNASASVFSLPRILIIVWSPAMLISASACPISRWLDGILRQPCSSGMISMLSPRRIAIDEYTVPRLIPISNISDGKSQGRTFGRYL